MLILYLFLVCLFLINIHNSYLLDGSAKNGQIRNGIFYMITKDNLVL